MKAKLEETGGFYLRLDAETVEEAALLVRFGINSIKNSVVIETNAFSDSICTWITSDRVANYRTEVQRKGVK